MQKEWEEEGDAYTLTIYTYSSTISLHRCIEESRCPVFFSPSLSSFSSYFIAPYYKWLDADQQTMHIFLIFPVYFLVLFHPFFSFFLFILLFSFCLLLCLVFSLASALYTRRWTLLRNKIQQSITLAHCKARRIASLIVSCRHPTGIETREPRRFSSSSFEKSQTVRLWFSQHRQWQVTKAWNFFYFLWWILFIRRLKRRALAWLSHVLLHVISL